MPISASDLPAGTETLIADHLKKVVFGELTLRILLPIQFIAMLGLNITTQSQLITPPPFVRHYCNVLTPTWKRKTKQ